LQAVISRILIGRWWISCQADAFSADTWYKLCVAIWHFSVFLLRSR
jgi:hypothetical protein